MVDWTCGLGVGVGSGEAATGKGNVYAFMHEGSFLFGGEVSEWLDVRKGMEMRNLS